MSDTTRVGGQQYSIDAACSSIRDSVEREANALVACDGQQAEEIVLRVVGLVAEAVDLVGEDALKAELLLQCVVTAFSDAVTTGPLLDAVSLHIGRQLLLLADLGGRCGALAAQLAHAMAAVVSGREMLVLLSELLSAAAAAATERLALSLAGEDQGCLAGLAPHGALLLGLRLLPRLLVSVRRRVAVATEVMTSVREAADAAACCAAPLLARAATVRAAKAAAGPARQASSAAELAAAGAAAAHGEARGAAGAGVALEGEEEVAALVVELVQPFLGALLQLLDMLRAEEASLSAPSSAQPPRPAERQKLTCAAGRLQALSLHVLSVFSLPCDCHLTREPALARVFARLVSLALDAGAICYAGSSSRGGAAAAAAPSGGGADGAAPPLDLRRLWALAVVRAAAPGAVLTPEGCESGSGEDSDDCAEGGGAPCYSREVPGVATALLMALEPPAPTRAAAGGAAASAAAACGAAAGAATAAAGAAASGAAAGAAAAAAAGSGPPVAAAAVPGVVGLPSGRLELMEFGCQLCTGLLMASEALQSPVALRKAFRLLALMSHRAAASASASAYQQQQQQHTDGTTAGASGAAPVALEWSTGHPGLTPDEASVVAGLEPIASVAAVNIVHGTEEATRSAAFRCLQAVLSGLPPRPRFALLLQLSRMPSAAMAALSMQLLQQQVAAAHARPGTPQAAVFADAAVLTPVENVLARATAALRSVGENQGHGHGQGRGQGQGQGQGQGGSGGTEGDASEHADAACAAANVLRFVLMRRIRSRTPQPPLSLPAAPAAPALQPSSSSAPAPIAAAPPPPVAMAAALARMRERGVAPLVAMLTEGRLVPEGCDGAEDPTQLAVVRLHEVLAHVLELFGGDDER